MYVVFTFLFFQVLCKICIVFYVCFHYSDVRNFGFVMTASFLFECHFFGWSASFPPNSDIFPPQIASFFCLDVPLLQTAYRTYIANNTNKQQTANCKHI